MNKRIATLILAVALAAVLVPYRSEREQAGTLTIRANR